MHSETSRYLHDYRRFIPRCTLLITFSPSLSLTMKHALREVFMSLLCILSDSTHLWVLLNNFIFVSFAVLRCNGYLPQGLATLNTCSNRLCLPFDIPYVVATNNTAHKMEYYGKWARRAKQTHKRTTRKSYKTSDKSAIFILFNTHLHRFNLVPNGVLVYVSLHAYYTVYDSCCRYFSLLLLLSALFQHPYRL